MHIIPAYALPVTFNHASRVTKRLTFDSIPPSPASGVSARRQSQLHSMRRSRRSLRFSLRSAQSRTSTSSFPVLPHHLFSAAASHGCRPEWHAPVLSRTARSSRTVDSASLYSFGNPIGKSKRGKRFRGNIRSAYWSKRSKFGSSMSPRSSRSPGPLFSHPIVPSQRAYAEELEQNYERSFSLSAPPRLLFTRSPVKTTTDGTRPKSSALTATPRFGLSTPRTVVLGPDVIRIPRYSNPHSGRSRISRLSVQGSYGTSFAESQTSSDSSSASPASSSHDEDSIVGDLVSGGRRRSASIPPAPLSRWPTFSDRNQFHPTGYRRPIPTFPSSRSLRRMSRPPALLLSMSKETLRNGRLPSTPRGPRPLPSPSGRA